MMTWCESFSLFYLILALGCAATGAVLCDFRWAAIGLVCLPLVLFFEHMNNGK